MEAITSSTRKWFSVTLIAVMLFMTIGSGPRLALAVEAPQFDLQLGKTATASTTQNEENNPSKAIDGLAATRWAADGSTKPQWIQVDLGQVYPITSVLTSYEFNNSYYQHLIEVSTDGENWETFADRTEMNELPGPKGYLDEVDVPVSGQYIRLTVEGTQHEPMWVSIRELRVNPQLGPVATASSEQGGGENGAMKAIDGDLSTRWAADGDSKPQWLMVDLAETTRVRTIQTSFEFSDSYLQYVIETSNDKINWSVFADKSSNTEPPGSSGYVDKGDSLGRYVRITVTATQAAGAWVSIREFQINSTLPERQALPDDMYNVAEGKSATASSSFEGSEPSLALDGSIGETRWSAANNDEPHWLQVDLGREYFIGGTRAFPEFRDAVYPYVIETSTDGETWELFANRSNNQSAAPSGYEDFGTATARYVKITIEGSMWKSLWEFEVFGTDNLAAGRSVAASSQQDEAHSPEKAVDGDRVTSRWSADGNSKPQWVEVDLGKNTEIARVETYFESLDSYYRYKIEVSQDRETWVSFVDRTANTVDGNPGYTDLGAVEGRYVRLTITDTETSPMWASVKELRVYGPESAVSEPGMKLASGNYELRAEKLAGERFGIGVYKNGLPVYMQDKPQKLLIKDEQDRPLSYEAPYRSVQLTNGKLVLTGNVETASGSNVVFHDSYSTVHNNGEFKLHRVVSFDKASTLDVGFNTEFSLEPQAAENMEQYEMLAPGNWYKKNANVVAGAIGSDYSDEYFYIREMRLALPFFMMRNNVSGETVSIGRPNAAPASDVMEATGEWLVDNSFAYGSLGVHKEAQPTLDFVYPGLEGEISYINRNGQMVRRSHKVADDAGHSYELTLRFGNETDYEQAVGKEWRNYLSLADPELKPVDLDNLYQNAIDLLDFYSKEYNGVMGLPFKADLPSGEVSGNAMVMGFVGQQLPAAYQMIRYGILHDDAELVDKGKQMVQFWADHSMTPSGLPKTWYEPYFEGTGVFTNQEVDLRTMSDGMEGAIDAYAFLKENGEDVTSWLNYSITFGNWLVDNQNEDGSYYRIYKLDGTPSHTGKYNSTNPIRFLLKLHEATGVDRYKEAAMRAGEFAYDYIYRSYQYVGGTSDNNNTIDKEAGAMAMNAFLALYDATKEDRWVYALQGAADYTATWTFGWTYHTPAGGTRWAANGDAKPQYLQVDLGEATPIASVRTYMEYPNMAYQYKIEISNDGSDWSMYADRTGNGTAGDPYYQDANGATARYVRLTVTGTGDPGAWVSIWEMQVLNAEGQNVALNQPTTASSSSSLPSNATDGHIHQKSPSPFPESGLVGQSLVSTGHSYADQYMAYMGAAYYRLYLLTGDTVYLNFAKLLQNNANYTADWKGEWGYAHPGLVEEGGSVTELQYYGIGAWLLWNTVAQLEPLSILDERFGSMSIDEIEQMPIEQRKALNGQSIGNPVYPIPPVPGSNQDSEVTIEFVDGKQILSVAKGESKAIIRTEQWEEVPVQFAANGGIMTVEPEVLKALLEKAGYPVGASFQFEIELAAGRIEAPEQGNDLRLGGQLYDFSIAIILPNGIATYSEEVFGGVEISLPYDERLDEKLLGIYYYNEQTRLWEYEGGEANTDSTFVTAKLRHLSPYAVLEFNRTFEDVPESHWAHDSIKLIASKHVMEGYPSGLFEPAHAVTRAEFVAVLARALKLEAEATRDVFTDVKEGAWYEGAVLSAYKAGIITGVGGGRFVPNESISRQEMAVMLSRAAGLIESDLGSLTYADSDQAANWAKGSILAVSSAGLMQGKPGHLFAPGAPASRAEVATVIMTFLEKF